MNKTQRAKRGFTLVELLVVIAIIGILAGFIVGGINRARTAAKVASCQNTLKQLATTMTAYYTDHNSYPPAYGYLSKRAFDEIPPEQRYLLDPSDPAQATFFVTDSYLNLIGLMGNQDYLDPFATETSDTDYDGTLSRLEYFPVSGRDDTVSDASSDLISLDAPRQRPFIYIPINQRQFRRAKDIWDAAGGFPDVANSAIQDANFHFPPASYDAFALVSVGIVGNTQGLIYDFGTSYGDLDIGDYPTVDSVNPPGRKGNYYYHISALATYYMLTRDIDNDGQRDFDFNARKSGDQSFHLFPYLNLNVNDAHGRSISAKIGPGIDGPIYLVQQ